MPNTIKNRSIRIAVLPFKILNENDSLRMLFSGFTEDLIISFSKFIGLSVISHFSTQHILDANNYTEIDKLGADFIISGRLRNIENRLRVSLQLIKTEDQSVVFAEHFEEPLEAILETQDVIIQQIVGLLQMEIDYNLLSHSYQKNTVDLAAYENYLRGMECLYNGSAKSDEEARVFFNSALAIDPHYAMAYTGLSLSYFNMWSCQLWDRWDISKKGAHKYALKAIELDPSNYLALGVLGRTYIYLGEFDQAEHCLRKSLRMNANDASHLIRVSFSLMYLGYPQDAIDLYHKAISINPHHNNEYFACGSNYYLELGDFKTSIRLGKKVDIDCWVDYPAWMAAAYLQENNIKSMWSTWNVYLELFEKEIYSGKEPLEAAALNWLLMVNPFKEKSYLNPLCDYVRVQKNIVHEKSELAITTLHTASFLFNGDVWEISYLNLSIVLKDMKGLHDIHKLIANPQKEYHCAELMESVIDEQQSIFSMDEEAKQAYLKKVKSLQTEIAEAEELNNAALIYELREEYETILEHLSQSLGRGGKSRKVGSAVEKARSAVTWRIRSAIKKMESIHPELFKHFTASIKTGTFCSYNPENEVKW